MPAKVQKIESSPNRRYSTSRFFEQKHSRDNPYDLSQGGSPEDPYELRSPSSTTSSHRPHKPPAHATVPEFRSAQPRNGVSKRPRRRRQKPSYDGSIKDFGGPGSPDVLAIDNDSPPPAEIISDVVPQKGMAKRARQPSFSGPQVKRPKPAHSPSESIEVSEDELQVTSKETKDGVLKRKTNFSGLRARNSIRARSRGDIPPTEFRSSKNPNASSTREEFGIFLKEAVCGSHMWSSKLGERAKLVPQYEDDSSTKSFRLSILSSRDGTAPENEIKDGQPDIVESMPWLHLILSKFEKVERGATHSSHVCIRRRITPGAPPVLHLHFDSEGDALAFIGRIPTSVLQVTDA